MSLSELVSLLLERGNAMQSFWGFYITVSLGLIAFFGSAKRPRRLAALVSLTFVAFAYVNADGMTDIARQREFLWKQLDAFSAVSPAASAATAEGSLSEARFAAGIKDVTKPPDSCEVLRFHIGCDIVVLAALWFLTLRRSPAGAGDAKA